MNRPVTPLSTKRAPRQAPHARKPETRGRRAFECGPPSTPARLAIDPAELHARIAEAAYFCAERRGFEPGREIDDWLQAERGIEQALGLRSEH
jgi:Protein of unknown function (DUF2934)